MEVKPVVAKDYALIDLHLDGSLSLASVRELAGLSSRRVTGDLPA